MVKWADYLISAVRYNAEHTHIEIVRVRKEIGGTIGDAEESTRSTVVTNIKNGNSYITIFKTVDEKWRRGEDVRVITIDGKEFIRTDANAKASDNLENLPEF